MATFNVNDTARRVQYTSSGQSSHTFNFQVNAISETQVHKNDTLLTEATHYNTSLNADGTGTITFTSGNIPTSGDIITIIGDQPLSSLFPSMFYSIFKSFNSRIKSIIFR